MKGDAMKITGYAVFVEGIEQQGTLAVGRGFAEKFANQTQQPVQITPAGAAGKFVIRSDTREQLDLALIDLGIIAAV